MEANLVDLNNLLSVASACKFLGRPLTTMYRWNKKCGLKFYKICGHQYVDKTDLEKFLPTVQPRGNPNFRRGNPAFLNREFQEKTAAIRKRLRHIVI